jgi:hypothetical protein
MAPPLAHFVCPTDFHQQQAGHHAGHVVQTYPSFWTQSLHLDIKVRQFGRNMLEFAVNLTVYDFADCGGRCPPGQVPSYVFQSPTAQGSLAAGCVSCPSGWREAEGQQGFCEIIPTPGLKFLLFQCHAFPKNIKTNKLD